MLDLRTNLIKKLFALVMVIMTVCSMAPVALAAGTNPLTFQGAYLTTTNHLTQSDPIKQTSTPGVSVIDNNNVPSGPQTIDIWIDKNFISDTIYEHNKGCCRKVKKIEHNICKNEDF